MFEVIIPRKLQMTSNLYVSSTRPVTNQTTLL